MLYDLKLLSLLGGLVKRVRCIGFMVQNCDIGIDFAGEQPIFTLIIILTNS